ncbi:universal stress protein [bacterium]|nr:universal stress protein [bacterium]
MKPLFGTLLVAINGSEASIDAFRYALAIKKQYGANVVACYVVDTAAIRQLALSRIFVPDESEEYERSLENSGRRYLSFCKELADRKRLAVEELLVKIIKAAGAKGADCIVIGGNPSEMQSRDTLADANREILRNARCPVLFVKPGMGEEAYRLL